MNEYDVAIIAYSPGGFAAAITLAQRGRRVLIVDQVRPHSGELVPRGGLFFQVLPELAREIKEDRNLFQVVIPQHRFSIPPGYHRFLTELGGEFPEVREILPEHIERVRNSGQTCSDYIKYHLIDRGTSGWKIGRSKIFESLSIWSRFQKIKHFKMDDLDQEFPGQHPIKLLFRLPGYFCSNLTWRDDQAGRGAFSAYLRFASLPLSPLAKPTPGLVEVDTIVAALRARAEDLNTEIVLPEQPDHEKDDTGVISSTEEIMLSYAGIDNEKKGGEPHRIETPNRSMQASSRGLIWSGGCRGFLQSLPDHFRKDRGIRYLSRTTENLTTDLVLDSLHLKVRPEAIPVGMEKRVFVIGGPERRYKYEDVILIRTYPTLPRAFSSGDITTLEGEAKPEIWHVHASYRRPVSESPEEAAEKIFLKISWLMPFLKEFILEGPDLLHGERLGLGGTPVWRESDFQSEPSRLTISIGRTGIFYCGRELLPALGGEADLLSGVVTAWKMDDWLKRLD